MLRSLQGHCCPCHLGLCGPACPLPVQISTASVSGGAAEFRCPLAFPSLWGLRNPELSSVIPRTHLGGFLVFLLPETLRMFGRRPAQVLSCLSSFCGVCSLWALLCLYPWQRRQGPWGRVQLCATQQPAPAVTGRAVSRCRPTAGLCTSFVCGSGRFRSFQPSWCSGFPSCLLGHPFPQLP